MKYIWDSNFGVVKTKGVDPQAVGHRLESLRAEVGEAITAHAVVEDARPPSSPTHPCFEWDDGKAANDWRLHQARNMLHTLKVVVENDGQPRSFVANVHVVTSDGENAYVPTIVAMSDPEYSRQVLLDALRVLEAFRRRYGNLKEVSSIVEAIDQVQATIQQTVA